MKKRSTLLLVVAMLILSIALSACSSSNNSNSSSSGSSEASSKEPVQTQQLGANAGADATELDFWTFVDLHGKHLDKMLQLWNEQNPDKQIKLNVTVMPYDDMHNKLLLAVQTGQGAPDIADVELGRFPNFLEGDKVPLEPLNDVFEPYKEAIVP
ncbi:MAG: extracellular solute-binding protein, partial [Cohnella sp.]|nr:extracellular solute-binding protein [Cohnella sp.]